MQLLPLVISIDNIMQNNPGPNFKTRIKWIFSRYFWTLTAHGVRGPLPWHAISVIFVLCALPNTRSNLLLHSIIGKTPVRIIIWCPITKMLIKACFLIQTLEQEGGCQKCSISLCSKVFINHFCQMKASPACLNILTYWSKYWVDRLRRTLRRKV